MLHAPVKASEHNDESQDPAGDSVPTPYYGLPAVLVTHCLAACMLNPRGAGMAFTREHAYRA